MKTFILLATVCLFGIASAAPATSGLAKDLQDFMDLLPVEEFQALGEKYKNDKEVLEAIEYLHSEEFAKIWAVLSASKEFKDFVYYLNDAGLQILDYLNSLASLLGLPMFPNQLLFAENSVVRTGGLKGLYDEELALLPKEEIKALFNEKMKNSKEFAELYNKISSADFQEIVKFVKDSAELTDAFNKLRAHGIEVDHIVDIMARVFGWRQ